MILSKIQRNIDNTIGFMSDFWTITAATEQSGYPASNLKNPDLNEKWVSWGQRASHNWIEAESDMKNAYRLIRLAGLFGIDRNNPSHPDIGSLSPNNYRVIIDSLYPVASRRRPAVTSIDFNNLSGTLETLNGPIDPPDLVPTGYAVSKMTAPNNSANTILIADFTNFNATERSIAPNSTQQIRVHYVHSTNSSLMPSISVRLRYGGVAIGSALTASDFYSTSEGWMFTYLFSSSVLPGLTGQLGIEVTGTANGASTPVPIGVEWVAQLEGWGTDDQSWDSNVSSFPTAIAYQQIVELPSKITDPDAPPDWRGYEIISNEIVRVYFELSDWIEQLEFSTVPLGGFEGKAFYAGRLVISEASNVDLKEIGGYNRRKGSDVNMLRARGGTFRGARNALHWTEHDFSARIQAQDLIWGELDQFFENAGMRNPVVLIPDESYPDQAIYGILTRWENQDVGLWTNESGVQAQYFDLNFSAIDARARRTLR